MYKRIFLILLIGTIAIFFTSHLMKVVFAQTTNISTSNPNTWTSGLVGYWSFDGQYTTTTLGTSAGTRDVSNNGNWGWFGGGTASAVPTPAAGISGQALSFDGVNDYVDIGNPASLQLTSSFTVEGWMEIKDTNPNPLIAKDMQVAGDRGWYFITSDVGSTSLRFLVSSNGTSLSYLTTTNSLSLNQWYHLAAVYNASAQTLKIYVDGIEWTGSLTGTVPASIYNTSKNVRIGAMGSYTNGLIDEVRVYNRALSADEIKQHYEQTRRKFVVSSSNPHDWSDGLVGYWSFDGQYTTTTLGTSAGTRDVSNNGNWGWFGGGTASAVPTPVAGISGQALSFDGVNDYVDAGNGVSLNPSNTITIEGWVNPANGSSGSREITMRTSTYYFRVASGNVVTFRMNNGTTWGTIVQSVNAITVNGNTWTNVVVTFDGTNTKIYFNGVVNVNSTTQSGETMRQASQINYMGAYEVALNRFNGLIDEVRIYNRALLADEVKQHYEQTRRKLGI